MSKTAVGLFENAQLADQVVHDLEAGGLLKSDVRILSEPRYMAVKGTMSTPHNDFQTSLNRDLEAIGATEVESTVYVEGVRDGGVLVFASGSDEKIDAAAAIMNRHESADVEEFTGGGLDLPSTAGKGVGVSPARSRAIHTAVYMRVV